MQVRLVEHVLQRYIRLAPHVLEELSDRAQLRYPVAIMRITQQLAKYSGDDDLLYVTSCCHIFILAIMRHCANIRQCKYETSLHEHSFVGGKMKRSAKRLAKYILIQELLSELSDVIISIPVHSGTLGVQNVQKVDQRRRLL